jgi:hypothetical protein
MSLTAKLSISLVADLKKTAVMGTYPQDPFNLSKTIEFSNGNGAGQANALYYAQRTLAGSASETLDISGSLTNNIGETFTIARVKTLIVINDPHDLSVDIANTTDLIIGAAAATQWAALLGTTGTITLEPGATSLHCCKQTDATAWVATGGSTDSLKIANGGATELKYQIVIIGAS